MILLRISARNKTFMNIFVTIVEICVLFYILGQAADFVIVNLRKLGESLGIQIFFLGLILGLITSLPELAIGITAFTSGLPSISVGNLLGGLVVLFGLILGGNLILNRTIATDGRVSGIAPVLLYLVAPLALAANGILTSLEGSVLLLGYPVLLLWLYRRNRTLGAKIETVLVQKKIAQRLLTVLFGVAIVLIVSNFIVKLTSTALSQTQVSGFVVGLLLFSLGTNLPEIIVTIRSWKRGAKTLSLSNILGSAMANIMLLGTFTFFKPVV